MSRFDASGGKMYVPRDRYSLRMSFCVVPGERRVRHALLVGEREVHAEQPHRGGVDRHRRVHLAERDAVEQRAHLAEVRHRHADLADLAPGEDVVGVVAGLGREVERDRQPGLPLGEVGAVQLVRRPGRRVPRVRADEPRSVGHRANCRLRRARTTNPPTCLDVARRARNVDHLSCRVRPPETVHSVTSQMVEGSTRRRGGGRRWRRPRRRPRGTGRGARRGAIATRRPANRASISR